MHSQTCEISSVVFAGYKGSEVTEGGKVKIKEWAFDLCDKKEKRRKDMGFLLISHGLPTVIAWASVFGFYSTVASK